MLKAGTVIYCSIKCFMRQSYEAAASSICLWPRRDNSCVSALKRPTPLLKISQLVLPAGDWTVGSGLLLCAAGGHIKGSHIGVYILLVTCKIKWQPKWEKRKADRTALVISSSAYHCWSCYWGGHHNAWLINALLINAWLISPCVEHFPIGHDTETIDWRCLCFIKEELLCTGALFIHLVHGFTYFLFSMSWLWGRGGGEHLAAFSIRR